MEDTFKVRVDKTFGSLQASSSSSTQSPQPSLNSLWSLTDEEIERNKWLQDKIDPQKDTDDLIHRLKNPKPYSPFLQGLVSQPYTSNKDLEADIQELDDDDDEDDDDEQQKLSKPEDHSNEEWDIRTSVGMDCTLDNEEEEDAFDKVAVGKEEPADRFYVKDVNDYEVDIDSNNELPSSITDVTRDPRANHTAAKLRLKEDDEAARKLGLQVSESNNQESNKVATESQQLGLQVSSKSSIPELNKVATESKQQIAMSDIPVSRRTVPDYLRNPSRYTRYTFDSMDNVDEESNRKAYMDFFNSVKKGSAAMEIEDDVSTDSLTSVVFTPRKKSGDVLMKNSKVDGHEGKKAVPISIADSDEVSMMDEDEPEISTDKSSSLQKSGRRYRTRGSTSDE